jgi:hypothetical protein
MAVDDQAGESGPAVAIGIVVEGADVGEWQATARSAAGGDFGHHGKTPFLFIFIVGHNSALVLFGNCWRRVKFSLEVQLRPKTFSKSRPDSVEPLRVGVEDVLDTRGSSGNPPIAAGVDEAGGPGGPGAVDVHPAVADQHRFGGPGAQALQGFPHRLRCGLARSMRGGADHRLEVPAQAEIGQQLLAQFL